MYASVTIADELQALGLMDCPETGETADWYQQAIEEAVQADVEG